MYVEEVIIDDYYRQLDAWKHRSDEEYDMPEPEMPLVLQEREQDEFENQPLAPDIMGMLGED